MPEFWETSHEKALKQGMFERFFLHQSSKGMVARCPGLFQRLAHDVGCSTCLEYGIDDTPGKPRSACP